MIAVLGERASRVAEALREAAEEGGFDERGDRTLRSRLAAAGSTASAVQDALDGAAHPVVDGVGNDLLGVRVLDFQLTVERLADAVRGSLAAGVSAEQRTRLGAALAAFAGRTRGPVLLTRPQGPMSPDRTADPGLDGRLERVGRVLAFGADAWARVATDGAGPGEPTRDAEPEPTGAGTDPSADRRGRLHDLARQAVQVAIAAALAIAAGTALSSTRWFWAVITAFVVYVGTSTRGDILSKGWLRVLGTLGGVVVGVLVAALVGGNTVLAIVLIVACLFSGVYLMAVSSAFMIFFITTMLALLYGLLGEFSIGLLLTRLAETAAGAVIGIGVAYVVLPTSTRDVARQRLRDLLDALAAAVEQAAGRLASAQEEAPSSAASAASAEQTARLRHALDALRTAARPITHGFAGVADRAGSRRTLRLLGACVHHGTALLRLADTAPGAAGDPALQAAFGAAADAVRADVEAFAAGLDRGLGTSALTPAAPLLDALEALPEVASSSRHAQLSAAIGDLRAIDQALCERAAELGATLAHPTPLPADAR